MSYPSNEACKEVIDDIWALIPEKSRHSKPYTGRYQRDTVEARVFGQESGTTPRRGSSNINHAGRIAFNSALPRAWDAAVMEPYEIVGTSKQIKGKILEREGVLGTFQKLSQPRTPVWDTRILWAKFGTYGLDLYNADKDYAWDTTNWVVMQRASDPDQVSIFAGAPSSRRLGTTNSRISATVAEGHFAFDRDEAEALLADDRYQGFLVNREEQAIMQSLRLTEQGLELFHQVLGTTLEYITEHNATHSDS